MEAYTDSVEAAQQRMNTAIEEWALKLNQSSAIKSFYDAITFATKNIVTLTAVIGGLLILTNLSSVINTTTIGFAKIGGKLTEFSLLFDRIITNLRTGEDTHNISRQDSRQYKDENWIFAQQSMYNKAFSNATAGMSAEQISNAKLAQSAMLGLNSEQKIAFANMIESEWNFGSVLKESYQEMQDGVMTTFRTFTPSIEQASMATVLAAQTTDTNTQQLLKQIASGQEVVMTDKELALVNKELKNFRESQISDEMSIEARKSAARGSRKEAAWKGAGAMAGGALGMFGGAGIGKELGGDTGKIIGASLGGSLGTKVGSTVFDGIFKGIKVATTKGLGAGLSAGIAAIGPAGFAGLAILIGAAVFSGIMKAKQKAIEEAQEAFKEAEQKFSAAKGSNVTAKQFDELAKGVDSFGNNLTLTDDEYQEFLDKSNELAELFPELVVRTDEAGNKLVGIGNIVGGVTEKVADLNRELQHQSDVNLLNKYVSGEAFNDSYSQIKDLQNKINAINLGDTNALKEVYDKYNVKYETLGYGDDLIISSVEDAQQAANARANMIQDYENQINSLKKTMENYSQASVRELGYVDEAFQSQLDSMSDAEQTVYQELISNIDYRKTNSDGSYQYDWKGNYKMKSDEEINQEIRDITNQVDTAFEKLGEENIEIAFKKPSDYETLEEMQKSRNQLRNAIISAFGEDGYDDTEKQIIMKLGFEVNENGVVTDTQDFVKKLRKEFNVKLFNGENISIENLKKLNFSDMQKAMEMLKEGTIDTTTSMETLVNLLYADREPPKTLESARKYTEETFALYDQLDNKAKNFFNTRGWENANIDEVFSKYPASIRGALKEAQESFKDGETDVSEFLDSISKMSASKIIDVMSNLAEVEIQSVFGEDFLGDIDGSINSLSELQKSLSAIADTYNKLGDAQKEQSLYGKLSLQTVTDLLASNINYAQVLEFETDEVTGNVTACKLKADAQKIMTEIQLRALKVNMQAAIAEEYQAIATNNAELAALGAADKQIDLGKNTAATIEVNNKAIKSFASVQGVISGVGAAIKALINGSSFAEIGAAYTNAYQTAMDKAAEGIQTAVWEKMYEKYTDEDKQERIDELVKLNDEAMARVNDYKLTISNIDTSIQTGDFTSLGADFGLDTTGKNLKDYDPMTKLETLKKLASLIDKEWKAMLAKNAGKYTEYFKKMGDNLVEQKKAVLEEIASLSAELEKLTPGTEEYDKKYSDLIERQTDLIDIEKKIANLRDEEIEDEISRLNNREATVEALIEQQKLLLKEADTEDEVIERQKELNDLVRQERDLRKSINEYHNDLLDTRLEYNSGTAYSDSDTYDALVNQKIENFKKNAQIAQEAIQAETKLAYQEYLKEIDANGNKLYTAQEAWYKAQNSEKVQQATKEYIEAVQAQAELTVQAVTDKLEEISRDIDMLEKKKPQEWSNFIQIKDYYDDTIDYLEEKIGVIREALKDTSAMTDDQIKDLVDQLNDATEAIYEAQIQKREDTKTRQESIYSALINQVQRYIDEIEDAKDAVEEAYKEPIQGMEDYNKALERTNKLLELQKNLQSATQEKQRVKDMPSIKMAI